METCKKLTLKKNQLVQLSCIYGLIDNLYDPGDSFQLQEVHEHDLYHA